MKHPIPLLALLLAAWLIGMSYFTRQSCGDCSSPSALLTPATTGVQNLGKSLLIADNVNSFSAKTDDNLTFNASNFAYQQPISEKLTNTFKEVATYLKAHPERSILVNGLYGEKETNKSIFPNLGIARAQGVKKLLEEFGCPEKQINVAALMSPMTNDSLMIGGANYTFMDTPKTDAPDLSKKLDKTITLYFDTNANSLTLSDEQRAFFADLINYLNKNPKATIAVTGHTDNKGDEAKNITLSQDRAAFVKKYLADNNINANQIVPAGKGPNVPVADNTTPEGRAKNRRVEVMLNKQ
jgi:OmpA-OmpF porin, OOP family